MAVVNIKNEEEFMLLIRSDKTSVVLFSADFAEQCKQVQDVLEEIAKLLADDLNIAKIEAEDFAEIALKYQVCAVPTVIYFTKGAVVDRVEGVKIASITNKCKKYGGKTVAAELLLEQRLKALINKGPLMIFMKGDPITPRCGFSKQLIAIINKFGFQYDTFDILSDEEVRQGLKTFSDWPTYPQVYVKGEFIGGLDIIKQLEADNQLEIILQGK